MDYWFLLLLVPLLSWRMRQEGLSRLECFELISCSSIPLALFVLGWVIGEEAKTITGLRHAMLAAVWIAVGFLWGRKSAKASSSGAAQGTSTSQGKNNI